MLSSSVSIFLYFPLSDSLWRSIYVASQPAAEILFYLRSMLYGTGAKAQAQMQRLLYFLGHTVCT